MVTRRTLFSDIAKHLVRWYSQRSDNADTYQRLSTLPRVGRYQIDIHPKQGTIGVACDDRNVVGVDFGTPTVSVLDSQRFAEVSATALQIVRRLGPDTGPLTFRQTHLFEVLAQYLTRAVTEQSMFSLYISSRPCGFHMGLTITSSVQGRVLANVGFDFTVEMTDEAALAAYDEYSHSGVETPTLFSHCFHSGDGRNNCLYLDSEGSLEALIHQQGTLTLVGGCWPFIAFTGLFSDYRDNRAGLALKTPHGWLVIMHDKTTDNNPYLCYQVPDEFGYRHHIRTGKRLNETQFTRLVNYPVTTCRSPHSLTGNLLGV